MLRLATLYGALCAVAACALALWAIGWRENLTATIDGKAAMEAGRLTAWGLWSILWRAGIAGFTGFVLATVGGHVTRRLRRR